MRGLLLVLAVTLGLTLRASATPPDPAVYLTENLTAVSTSPAISAMEQALLDRIDAASISIDAAFYDFKRVRVRDALLAAQRRGVTVRVVADDEARSNPSYAPHFAALEAAGIPIVDDQSRSRIMHNKYLIFDRQAVWTGSTNLSDNDFTLNHNNSIVFTGTEMAALFQHDFDQMVAGRFGRQKTASPTTAVLYQGLPVEVYFSPQDGVLARVVRAVQAAETSIDFAIFFFTEDTLRDALIDAKNRGVAIRGLWDALGASNTSSDDEALCAAGIPIKIENTTGKMHHKLMVVDARGRDPAVITGSLNWTAAASERNSENTVIVHGGAVAAAYAAGFQAMWSGISAAPCVEERAAEIRLFLPLVASAAESETTTEPSVPAETPTETPVPAETPTEPPVPTETPTEPSVPAETPTEPPVPAETTTEPPVPAETTTEPFVPAETTTETPTETPAPTPPPTPATAEPSVSTETSTETPTPTPAPTPPPTPELTETPTPTPSVAVRLARIVYDPAGSDVDGERVEIRNVGEIAAELSGWTLADAASYRYTFPAFTLAAGATVTVWVKAGTDTASDLYSGRGAAVWNNNGDSATLADADGARVDVCAYAGGAEEMECEPG